MKVKSKKERLDLLRKLVLENKGRCELAEWWRITIAIHLYDQVKYTTKELEKDMALLRNSGLVSRKKINDIMFYEAM